MYFILSGLLSNIFGLQGMATAYGLAWLLMLFWAMGCLWQGNLEEVD